LAPSHALYDTSRIMINGAMWGNRSNGTGIDIFMSARCVSVGGRLKRVDEEMDVLRKTSECRGGFMSASSMSHSQSAWGSSPVITPLLSECDRMK